MKLEQRKIKVDGTVTIIRDTVSKRKKFTQADIDDFRQEELKASVGGYDVIAATQKDAIYLANEEGIPRRLKLNNIASLVSVVELRGDVAVITEVI